MRQPYVSPAVIEYGSIADRTFVTPAVASNNPGILVQYFPKIADGDYQCDDGTHAGDRGYAGKYQGGKNYQILLCDKFGEYSHGDSAGS